MSEAGELIRVESAGDLARTAANLILERAREATSARGTFHLVLSGGSTPRAVYGELARSDATLESWHVWFGDERCVPPDHPDSNYRMVRESGLFDRLAPERVHRLRGEAEPAAEARRYQGELVDRLGQAPRLDLVLLGLGSDGHTASLFPATDSLATEALVTVGRAPAEPRVRLTMTLRLFVRARVVLFLVSGASKREALQRARGGSLDTPAARVRPESGELLWLVDREAAPEG